MIPGCSSTSGWINNRVSRNSDLNPQRCMRKAMVVYWFFCVMSILTQVAGVVASVSMAKDFREHRHQTPHRKALLSLFMIVPIKGVHEAMEAHLDALVESELQTPVEYLFAIESSGEHAFQSQRYPHHQTSAFGYPCMNAGGGKRPSRSQGRRGQGKPLHYSISSLTGSRFWWERLNPHWFPRSCVPRQCYQAARPLSTGLTLGHLFNREVFRAPGGPRTRR